MTIDRKLDHKFKEKFEAEMGPVTFAMFMRVARTTLDITQEDMGKKLRISKANVCDIEKGRQLVSPEFAIKVARKAGLSEKQAIRTCLQDQVRKAGSDAIVMIA